MIPTICDKINVDISEGKTIFVVCGCAIEYRGRSRAVIGPGQRIILIKPDSTLIIHSNTGFKPLNWMSPPNDTIAEIEDEKTILYSQRTREPFEEIKITIDEVLDYHSYSDLSDTEKITVTHTEKDLQQYLKENPALVHPDFRLKTTEYQSPVGYFDLYGKIGERYAVVELKSVRAGLPAALQIVRYRNWLNKNLKQETIGMLVAPSITPNALILLKTEGIDFMKFNMSKIKHPSVRRATLERWMQ